MKQRRLRYILLTVMTVFTAVSLMLIPRINVNEDMTQYLPDSSRMKAGVDSLKQYFPEIDLNAYFVKAMFSDVDDSRALGEELTGMEGVGGITAVSENGARTMYQLSVREGADPIAISEAISERYGEKVTVENNANSIMPDNMVLILIIGITIVFAILFLMCSSFVEALLFILTIGMAVIMNMGTNAFLPSVSMMTNTIVAVLQFVLSMDYSIILMNRFRQVLVTEPDIDKAMRLAMKNASPSILSSSFTTMVGLLALVFMKFKIGLDLGLVLSKGVLFSLISIYTILPALILIFYKGIKKTEKRVFLIPTDRLSRFEFRSRVPLTIAFVVIFGSSWYLSKKTELSYASIWESRINEYFPPQNAFSLLYRTSSEDKVIALTDSIAAKNNVIMALNYPAIFRRELTAEEMCGNINSLLELLPNMPDASLPDLTQYLSLMIPETMRVLYYSATHPVRDERMSFEDMIQLASEASEAGLLPDGIDIDAVVNGFMAPDEAGEQQQTEPAAPHTPKLSSNESDVLAAATFAPGDPGRTILDAGLSVASADTTTAAASLSPSAETAGRLTEQSGPTVDEGGEDPYRLQGKYRFTKEALCTQMNSTELAEYLGFSRGQASAVYAIARKKNGTMSPDEFISFMIDKVLGSKVLRKMISDSQAEGLYFVRGEMDAVLAVPDVTESKYADVSVPETAAGASAAGSVGAEAAVVPAVDASVAEASAHTDTVVLTAPAPTTASGAAPDAESTPMERLAEMYASGKKYTAGQIYSSLHAAGIELASKPAVELMFTFYGSRHNYPDSTRMTLDGIVDFLSTEVASNDVYAVFMNDTTRTMLADLRGMVDEGMKMLRKDKWSMSAIVTDLPVESAETFDFVENTISECGGMLGDDEFYLVGESVMYTEMKDGFRSELVFLTLLTVVLIFIIVAITFKSFLIPVVLVMVVMSSVFANVFFSGLGGNTMLYLAYLIVQSILMGATVDYGILYTNYYIGFRREGQSIADSLKLAYRGSIHTIMTSGLIIVLAPFIMAELLSDPTICSILSSLSFGALAAILLIILILPAVLATMYPAGGGFTCPLRDKLRRRPRRK